MLRAGGRLTKREGRQKIICDWFHHSHRDGEHTDKELTLVPAKRLHFDEVLTTTSTISAPPALWRAFAIARATTSSTAEKISVSIISFFRSAFARAARAVRKTVTSNVVFCSLDAGCHA